MINKFNVEFIEEVLCILLTLEDEVFVVLFGVRCFICSLSCFGFLFLCLVILLLVVFLFLLLVSICFCRMEKCFLICFIDVMKIYIKIKLIIKIYLVKIVILVNLFDCIVKWSLINGLIIKLRLEKVLKLFNILG